MQGEIIGFALSGALIGTDVKVGGIQVGGWASVFYLYGLFGIVWFPFFLWRVYNTPEEHPSISTEEISCIREGTCIGCLHRLRSDRYVFCSVLLTRKCVLRVRRTQQGSQKWEIH